jgi:peroxiredoxin
LWKGDLPLSFGVVIVTNDLIWLPFFYLILRGVYRDALTEQVEGSETTLQEVIDTSRFSNGATLAEMSAGRSVAVLFVRHLGCTFCREAIAMIVRQREQLRVAQVSVVVVHMNESERFAEFARKRGIADLPALSDPHRRVYRAFKLSRGTLMQLFGPKVWFGALRAVRFGVGLLEGDGLQMPGAFLIRDGRMVREFRHPHAAAAVDLCEFATRQE